MKKTSLIAALLLAAWSVQAQKNESKEIPASVLQNFQKLYPGVSKVKWETEEDGNYEASYKQNKIESEILFSKEGEFLQSSKSLSSPNALPPVVLSSLKKDFSGYTYEDAETVETKDKKVFYEVEAEKAQESFELLYDEKGTLIKKTKQEEKKEN